MKTPVHIDLSKGPYWTPAEWNGGTSSQKEKEEYLAELSASFMRSAEMAMSRWLTKKSA